MQILISWIIKLEEIVKREFNISPEDEGYLSFDSIHKTTSQSKIKLQEISFSKITERILIYTLKTE